MKYFNVIYYTTGGEYETREFLIDEVTFRQFQKAIMNGNDFLIQKDKVIKRNMIKEILPADELVKELTLSGQMPLSRLGLPERDMLPAGKEEMFDPENRKKYEAMKLGAMKDMGNVPDES